MSQVFFISDLHFGHRRVIDFEDHYRGKVLGVASIEDHDAKLCDLWTDTVTRRDTVYLLGDLGYGFEILSKLPGRKKLLLGNHDTLAAKKYLEVVDDIVGPVQYKKFWLAHIPSVEEELYGRKVIHGHTHSKGVADPRYVNVCVEMCGGKPVPFVNIASGQYQTHHLVNKSFEDMITARGETIGSVVDN